MANEFQIDIKKLRSSSKVQSPSVVEQIDTAADELGFVDRTPRKKRGRPKSPRTGQVHAKVLPHVSEQIADEAKRRGTQQGVILEEAWELYKKARQL